MVLISISHLLLCSNLLRPLDSQSQRSEEIKVIKDCLVVLEET